MDWALRTEGSSRSSALIRIGLAVLLWARWAEHLVPWHERFVGSLPWLAIAISFYASTTLMLVGWWSRFATAWAGVTALAIYHASDMLVGPGPWLLHHTYLLAFTTLLCAFTPCDRSYSVDRWRAVRRAERRNEPPPPERGNLWALRLIALQVSAVYLWSAYAKLNWGFLSGDRLDHILMWFLAGSDPVPWRGWPAAMMIAAWGTVTLQVALGAGLLFDRTRRWLVLPGMAMHGIYYLLMPVGTYSATIWLLYLAYFNANAVHGVIDRMSGVRPTVP